MLSGNAKTDDKEKGICFNYSRGNGYCKYAEACKFKHEGPKGGGDGGKRKHSSSLVAAKGAPKKKQKGPQAKAVQRIASIVARDLKQMFKSEKEHDQEDESSNEKDEMVLFNLVRGGNKKRVNFLLTSAVCCTFQNER